MLQIGNFFKKPLMLKINTKIQTLTHYKNNNIINVYKISSAKNGLGEITGSKCTPRGIHKISQKIGDGLKIGAILVGRIATGEIYNTNLAKQYPQRDWILTRILWLDGCQDFNQNSKARHIYIHGTPDTEPMGRAKSHGCIRLRNTDIIELFTATKVDENIIIK